MLGCRRSHSLQRSNCPRYSRFETALPFPIRAWVDTDADVRSAALSRSAVQWPGSIAPGALADPISKVVSRQLERSAIRSKAITNDLREAADGLVRRQSARHAVALQRYHSSSCAGPTPLRLAFRIELAEGLGGTEDQRAVDELGDALQDKDPNYDKLPPLGYSTQGLCMSRRSSRLPHTTLPLKCARSHC